MQTCGGVVGPGLIQERQGGRLRRHPADSLMTRSLAGAGLSMLTTCLTCHADKAIGGMCSCARARDCIRAASATHLVQPTLRKRPKVENRIVKTPKTSRNTWNGSGSMTISEFVILLYTSAALANSYLRPSPSCRLRRPAGPVTSTASAPAPVHIQVYSNLI